MVQQARARNATTVQSGRVDLRQGSVGSLPFRDNSFDKAMAVNSMQVWPNAAAGLQEVWRVLKPAGRIALGFTHHSGQANKGLETALVAAGFTDVRTLEAERGFGVLATKPNAIEGAHQVAAAKLSPKGMLSQTVWVMGIFLHKMEKWNL
jgi:ubiquinone/menaquinone biosynthesis C-methylase UbiE